MELLGCSCIDVEMKCVAKLLSTILVRGYVNVENCSFFDW